MKMNLKIILFTFFAVKAVFSQTALPTGTSVLFSGSGNCILCHKSNGDAMTWNGQDISPITYWRSTMMGNASKDPLWRAMVAEEVSNFPQHQQMIETTCTKCHSPVGFTQAMYNGQNNYSMNELKQNPLANDGVSCTVCHQIKPDNFGTQQSYSGNYIIHADSILYGPYDNSDTTLMRAVIGYKAQYSPHINNSELCATCHTLFTPTMNGQGNIVGSFPEQTPYLEWKNSIYPSLDIQCQSCHMPKIYDPIKISGMGNFPNRTPFWRHTFVGGNVYMLNLLKNNIDSLGLTAEPVHFDSTISRTEYNLKENSIELTASTSYQNDLLSIKLYIKNLTGHKIPTGIPFRRMWVHLKVEDENHNVIFESGQWDNTGKIINYNSDYEPHYDLITSEDQVQVYEGVFADVNNQVTYTLFKASHFVKDNRLPPIGFITTHPSYDSIKIVGDANNDSNFNRYGTYQGGTGGDSVIYLIPALPNKYYRITAEVCYQSVKPQLVDHIRNIINDDIYKFVTMYDALPNLPFIMKREVLDIVTGIEDETLSIKNFSLEQNYPNPFNPSTRISWQSPVGNRQTLKVYDILGNEVATLLDEYKPAGKYEVEFDAAEVEHGLSLPSGIYFYKLQTESFTKTMKMVLMK
ncbi:MAG: T9SS type A sorting domain-containing protein [Ignavibacterium album]|uniref:T9SS type A sorting domain-containing protein n=1 Tax=Ignavibacterium album TaxID=591197 RepID=UPI0026F2930B|nr:T9SS type A sorting domain-containing protein [Ignavibacterium album]MCX8104448.1 T9SS type A sorting domain-containing protein [Ignavibacterium album]